MVLRFRKSLSVLPGVRLNLSKSGASVSLGTNGARLNLGPRGVRTTVGVPGTGISHVTQTGWAAKPGGRQAVEGIDWDRVAEDEARAIFVRLLAASPLADVKRQLREFNAYVAAHPGELTEPEVSTMRQLYADEIARKSVTPQSTVVTRLTEPIDPQSAYGRFIRFLFFMLKMLFCAVGVLAVAAMVFVVLAIAGVIG